MSDFEKNLVGRPNTVKTQACLFRKWIEPYVLSVRKPDKQFCQRLIATWQGHDLKPGTIRVLANILKKYIEWDTGQVIQLKVSRAQQAEVKAWTYKETKKATWICQLKDKKFYPLLICALHTGVRKGELFGFLWSDIDFVNGKIKVQRSFSGPTKNGKSRVIPMTDELAILLEKRYLVGQQDTLVFPRMDVNFRLKRLCKLAGVRQIPFHGLRHSFATLALEAGRSPKLVSMILGHTNVSTTLNLYWSCTKEELDLSFLP